jgi:hypothetical protein
MSLNNILGIKIEKLYGFWTLRQDHASAVKRSRYSPVEDDLVEGGPGSCEDHPATEARFFL